MFNTSSHKCSSSLHLNLYISLKICLPKCPWARCWTPNCASYNNKVLLIDALYECVCDWVNVKLYCKELWVVIKTKALYKYKCMLLLTNTDLLLISCLRSRAGGWKNRHYGLSRENSVVTIKIWLGDISLDSSLRATPFLSFNKLQHQQQ